MDETGTRLLVPSTINSGQIRSLVVSTFSRTSRLAHSVLRLRRMRIARSSDGEEMVVFRGPSRISMGRPNLIAILQSPDRLYFLTASYAGLTRVSIILRRWI